MPNITTVDMIGTIYRRQTIDTNYRDDIVTLKVTEYIEVDDTNKSTSITISVSSAAWNALQQHVKPLRKGKAKMG
jgi:hypothetical protein